MDVLRGVLQRGLPVSRLGRRLLAGGAVVLLAGFAIAAWVTPDPRGFGSHEALGLPPCAIRRLTGKPCPGCGMTTSIAHLVRGQWAASWRANPAGLVVGLSAAPLVLWCAASAWTGRAVGFDDPWILAALISFSWSGTGAVVWGLRWWPW